MKKTFCVVLGTIASVVPFGAGLVTFFDPLRKKAAAGAGTPVRVASLSALPKDGVPRKFAVVANKSDAWNKYPNVPIGAVYLRRTPDDQITAFNVVCPHAGCFVDFMPERKDFLCPCHNSTFAIDGSINDPKSPSPRGLDSLSVEVRGNEIYVAFQNFRAGTHERIPEA